MVLLLLPDARDSSDAHTYKYTAQADMSLGAMVNRVGPTFVCISPAIRSKMTDTRVKLSDTCGELCQIHLRDVSIKPFY
jgi:hypothetical protein